MEGNTHAVRVPPCLDFLCLDGINADIYGGASSESAFAYLMALMIALSTKTGMAMTDMRGIFSPSEGGQTKEKTKNRWQCAVILSAYCPSTYLRG